VNALVEKWNDLSERHPDFSPLMTTFLVLVGLMVLFGAINPRFFSPFNLHVMLLQSSAYLILVVGMTFVITSGGIDISVGSQVALIATIGGYAFVTFGLPLWLSFVITVFAGGVMGLFNSIFISKFRVSPIIVTIGTFTLFRGLAYVILEYRVIFGFPESLLWLARGRILGLAPAIYLGVIVVIIGHLILNSTRFGTYVTSIGANQEASKLAGIAIWKMKFFVYIIMGVTCGIATMVWLARLNAAQAALGYGVEFHTIAAVVLGGTSIYGGKGLMIGAALGALVLGVVENGLVVIGLSYYWQQVLLGLIFISVVIFRTIQQREGQLIS